MNPVTVVARGPFTIRDLGAPPELSRDLHATVDAHWAEAQQRRPELFDADIFFAVTIEPGAITGCFLPYRYNLALFENPALRDQVPLVPLGVTGATRADDGAVLLARRAPDVTLPGVWELAPAGGINRDAQDATGAIDPRRLLLDELAEETGISASAVRDVQELAAVNWRAFGVSEITFSVQTTLSRAEIEAAFAQRGTTEYDAMRWWSPGDPVDDDIAEPVAYLNAVLAL